MPLRSAKVSHLRKKVSVIAQGCGTCSTAVISNVAIRHPPHLRKNGPIESVAHLWNDLHLYGRSVVTIHLMR